MWRSRTFWRLFSAFGLLWLISQAVLGLIIEHRVEQHFLAQIESDLRTKAILLRDNVLGRTSRDGPALQELIEASKKEIATRITLITASGAVLADSDKDPRHFTLENHYDRPEIRQAEQQGFGLARRRHSATVDQDMMYLALRTDDPRGEVAYVRVAVPLDSVQGQLAELRGLVWSAALVTGLAGMLLALLLARRMTRPLRELHDGAERIAAGNYGQKVFIPGKDELADLAHTFNQMSERLAAQFAQLAEDRQKLQAVLGGMIEGVIALDAGETILFANDRAGQLLGFEVAGAIGRKLWEVVRLRPLHETVRRAFRDAQAHGEDTTWSGAAAKNLSVNVARLPGDPSPGAVIVLHDTTELRRLERVRQEFVANVSHELKTPLAVIKANVETLLGGAAADPEPRTMFLQRIAEQADRLHALIIDLLSLARIESGTEVFEFGEIRLDHVVHECVQHHQTRAHAKMQSLEATPPAQPDGTLAWADHEAVQQILDNLVDNALKYTPEGGRICVGWNSDQDYAYLQVKDTGIGIPESDLPRVFERFFRVDKARSREMGGTGLGLSIVKHLVRAMHGTVSATSRLNQGTTFEVKLPRMPVS